MGRTGRCSQDLLCPRRLRRSGGGEDRGKSSQSKVGHISRFFSQVSIEHLLDAWHWDWGCCQGLGRNGRSSWALKFPQETMPGEAAAQDQVMERKGSLDPLSPPASLPSPSLPSSRLHLLGSTPSHQFLPHFPALPGFSLEGPFFPARSRC